VDSPLTTPTELVRLAVWLGVVAVVARGRGGRRELLALGALALLALGAYTGLGRFHGDGRLLHDHELVHYTLGSRYHHELGHEGLYAALHATLREEAPAVGEGILAVKNLRTYALEPAAISAERGREIMRTFSPTRRDRFRADVGCFVDRLPPREWAVVLADHGYNATPFWTMIGGALTGEGPLTPTRLRWLALLDPLLLVGALGFLTWALGLRTGLLATVAVLAFPLAPFDVVGGAYLRQLWLAGVLVFVAARRRGLPLVAGAALAVAALDRVFPAALLLVPLVEAVSGGEARRPARREVTGFVATAAALGVASVLLAGGLDAWRAFASNVIAHDRWFYLNQLGFRHLLEVDPVAVLGLEARGWDEGSWLRLRETRADRVAATVLTARIAVVVLASVAIRRAPTRLRMPIAAFLPFFLTSPAHYYHVLLVVPFLAGGPGRRLSTWIAALMVGVIVGKGVFPHLTQLEAVHWALAVGLTLAFVHEITHHVRRAALPRPAWLALVLVPLVGIGVDGVRANRPATSVDLDLLPVDVDAPSGVEVSRTSTLLVGGGWGRNDHVVVAGPPGVPIPIRVPSLEPGRYRGRLIATAAPGYGGIRVEVGATSTRASLLAAEPHPVIVPLGPFDPGRASGPLVVTLAAPPNRTGPGHAGLDRLELWPEPDLDRELALDRARRWIASHPADLYDGGIAGIADEAWTFHLLTDDPDGARRAVARVLSRAAAIATPATDHDRSALARLHWLAEHHRLALPDGLDRAPGGFGRGEIDRERATRGLGTAFAAGVPLPAGRVTPAVAALTEQLVGLGLPGSPATSDGAGTWSEADRAWWRAWHQEALAWAVQHGSPVTLARLIDSAGSIGPVPHRDAAITRLLALTGPDGTLGVDVHAGPNQVRGPVLAGARALHHLGRE